MGRGVEWALFFSPIFPLFQVGDGVASQQSRAQFPEHGIDEVQFNEVLDVIEAVYGPLIEHRGLKFIIQRNWTDGTVNAIPFSSSSFMGLAVYGGLARYRGMTQDSFALVTCHELATFWVHSLTEIRDSPMRVKPTISLPPSVCAECLLSPPVIPFRG